MERTIRVTGKGQKLVLYSAFANCSAIKLLPTRRAPSIIIAVVPLLLFFQAVSASYIFLFSIPSLPLKIVYP